MPYAHWREAGRSNANPLGHPMSRTQTGEQPAVIELFAAIKDLFGSARGFEGVVVRNVSAKYANKQQFYSGAGAAKTGGRWNRRGLAAVYASLDVQTATAEAYQDFIYRGFPLTAIQPRVTAGARVRLSKLLDVTDTSILAQLGFTRKELLQEDWRALQREGEESWTQAIGRGAFLAGFEGVLVPSAQHKKGKNIVLFPGNFTKTSQIEILGSDQLPN